MRDEIPLHPGAVSAAQITAIGDTQAQIIDPATELVETRGIAHNDYRLYPMCQ
jgi:hypothetical protein